MTTTLTRQFHRLLDVWQRQRPFTTPAEQRAFLLGCLALEHDQAWLQKHTSRAGSRKHHAAITRLAAVDAALAELHTTASPNTAGSGV